MKKLCLLAIALCTVCASYAQTELSVPDLTLEQKLGATKALMNRNICSCIVEAKTSGISAEEYGKKIGQQWIPVWEKTTGFEEFVGFNLWAWAVMADEVKVSEQSADKVVLVIPSVDKELEEAPILETFSIEDLVAYNSGMMQVIAAHLGYKMKLSWGDNGMTAVISK